MRLVIILAAIVLMIKDTYASLPFPEYAEQTANIRTSKEYIWGEGTGENIEKAESAAMRDLVEKIYIAVSTSTQRKQLETDREYADSVKQVINTYSALQLTNLQKLQFQDKGKMQVFAYIDTTSLNRSFELSRQSVKDMVDLAKQSESEGRIGDALRWYYWAYLLTHTYFGSLDLAFESIPVSNAQYALGEKLKMIGKEIKVVAENGKRSAGTVVVPVEFFYRDQPIQNLESTYYCGEGDDYCILQQSNKAYLTLLKEPTQHRSALPFNIEYVYLKEMCNHPEIEQLYEIFRGKTFELSGKIEVVCPWVEAVPEKPGTPEYPEVTLPAPRQIKLPFAIEVLSASRTRKEFLETLEDYQRSGRLKVAVERARLAPEQCIFLALLSEAEILAILSLDEDGYIDIKTKKVYTDFKDAYKGEARLIWIGVACP